MEKNKLLPLLILTFFLLALQVLCGCGTVHVKKDTARAPEIICDKKADEALKNRDYEKSIILHEFFLKENPDNALAMYHMGFSYGQLGEHEDEIKWYEKAIKLGFHGSGIFFNLGMAYGETGRLDDSVRVFRKAIELEPGRADNHFGLALTYQRMASNQLAEKEFKKVIEIDPKDIDAFYFLGRLYVETGNIEKARDQLEKLMKIAPDNGMTLELKNMLESKK